MRVEYNFICGRKGRTRGDMALPAIVWTWCVILVMPMVYAGPKVGCFKFNKSEWDELGSSSEQASECVDACQKKNDMYEFAGVVGDVCFCRESTDGLTMLHQNDCPDCAGEKCGNKSTEVIVAYKTKAEGDGGNGKAATEESRGNVIKNRARRQDCGTGTFGPLCTQMCHCLDNTNCNASGGCPGGCAEGWTGATCSSEKCADGMFGLQCKNACLCADASQCKEDGSCGTSGCIPGYKLNNSFCQECEIRKFGANCQYTCKCIEDCDKVTGKCSSACQAGFTGNTCSTPCSPGKYGRDCAFDCKDCSTCDSSTGACLGSSTTNSCDLGRYGTPCDKLCFCKADVPCSVDGKCPDGCRSDYKGDDCSERVVQKQDLSDVLIPALGGVAGVLLLVFIILCVVLMLRRKRRGKKARNDSQPIDPANVEEGPAARPVSTASGDVATAGVVQSMSPEPPQEFSIAVADLEAKIKRTRETEKVPFLHEYQALPEGPHAKWDFGLHKSIHRDKNRFGNIIAYDHSRVPLMRKKDNASEYINANFINGYKVPKAYIATQGPMPQTVKDFWRMCWEQNVHIIVMVTNCIEAGRVKCECYWPELTESKAYDDIKLTTTKEEIFPDYTIRTLKVEKGDRVRITKHFQFTGWPDHGVPRQATPLLTLRRRVRAETAGKAGAASPIVVHCSAGVGRSGTYIAVDNLINQADEENKIDVFGCVWRLRVDRVNMVQTWDQYNFIYDALLEAVTVGQTTIPCYKFEETYPDWMKPDPETGINKLEQQLRILGVVKPIYLEQELDAATDPENKEKNRRDDIIPANFYRPFLTPMEGRNNYINAVFVQGYYRRDAYLVTQSPLPNTRMDFWRMVYDSDCRSIVCLQDYSKSDPKTPLPWPEPGSTTPIEYGPLTVSSQKTVSYGSMAKDITGIECVLKNSEQGDETRTVYVFSVKEFPAQEQDPIPAKTLFQIKDQVQKWQQNSQNQTVVVMCKYGLYRSGIYCALDCLIDMIKTEQELDVFQVVRQVQMSRPQLVSDMKQYKYLYDAAKTYLDINLAYHNFQ